MAKGKEPKKALDLIFVLISFLVDAHCVRDVMTCFSCKEYEKGGECDKLTPASDMLSWCPVQGSYTFALDKCTTIQRTNKKTGQYMVERSCGISNLLEEHGVGCRNKENYEYEWRECVCEFSRCNGSPTSTLPGPVWETLGLVLFVQLAVGS